MPLRFDIEKYLGTNSDGSRSDEYCYYCLKDGKYIVDIPMSEMINIWIKYTDKYNEYADTAYSPKELRRILNERLPKLNRWKQKLETSNIHHQKIQDIVVYINNLEWTKAILTTAQELNSPVILGVSEGAGKYMTGYKTVVGMVNGMMEELGITVPVALHLDHGSYEGCLKCVEAGFSSIMFDGSHYPIPIRSGLSMRIRTSPASRSYSGRCLRCILPTDIIVPPPLLW